ncbi:MAG TPA: lysylphosphatidylglycerol synthase transmembrane domain-containing protein [Anaeromyxobacteraceae bacterium]|nr:lysylphosphatidylglycerol synthase transmembrane domain-containing protein [Anaeromyxobacteraceae bacterium]
MKPSSAIAPRAAAPLCSWSRALLGLAAGLCAVAGVVLYLGISRRDLGAHLHELRTGPLLFAAAGALVLLSLQALRWWLVMRPALGLQYFHAHCAMAVGFLFNVLLPARGGDLLRVQYLGRRTGRSRAKIFGTAIIDFWTDKLGWVVSFPLVCLLGNPPAWLLKPALLLGSLVVGVGALLAILASRIGQFGGVSRGPQWLRNLREGFAAIHWKRLLGIELLVAPLPWLWETLVLMVAAHTFGMRFTAMQAFSLLTAFNVATVVPSPGNTGSFEAGGALALIAFGMPRGTALTFVFLYHLTQVVPTVTLGALVLISQGEKLFGRDGLAGSPCREATTDLETPTDPSLSGGSTC